MAWLGAFALHASASAPAAADEQIAPDKLRRALGLIQYVAVDYPEAVAEDGRIVNADEFEEQSRLLGEAEALLLELPRTGRTGLRGEMRALLTACRQGRPPGDVVPRARRLHTHVQRVFADVPLAPQQVPSLAAGRILYAQACAICHGGDGRAQTPAAQTLNPPPRDFLAPEQDDRLSPYRAYNAISFGIPGTGMASFETLDDEERWDLAFWVLAMRHSAPHATADSAANSSRIGSPTLQDVTFATDAELERSLAAQPEATRRALVSRWRWSPPHVIE
jgi:high-affinity iron transporter